MKMKKLAVMAAYTAFCLLLGGLLFQGVIQASGWVDNDYCYIHELGCPGGYRSCMGVDFKGDVTKSDVIIDWKSNNNFVIFVKE